jgi:hypothetical protein
MPPLSAPRPIVHGLALAVLALAFGCSCPDATVVVPIEPYRYHALQSAYGWEALPNYECDAICLAAESGCTTTTATGGSSADGGGGLSAGGGGAGGGNPSGGAGGGSSAGGGAGAAPGGGGSGSGGIDCSPYQSFAYVSECKLTTIEWTRPAVVCVGTVQCM